MRLRRPVGTPDATDAPHDADRGAGGAGADRGRTPADPGLLHDRADEEQVDSAVLMVSEMVTNVLMSPASGQACHTCSNYESSCTLEDMETKTYSTIDLRKGMGEILDRTRIAGEASAITRKGKTIAYLVPAEWFEQMTALETTAEAEPDAA